MLQPWFLWSEEAIASVPKNKDVLALQEVWTTELRDQILEKVGDAYPHHYWPEAHNEKVGCDMTVPTIPAYSWAYIDCLQRAGVDTQTVQQPLTAVPYDCLAIAIGIVLSQPLNPANQLCLACLINTMENLAPADAMAALQICGAGEGPKYGHQGINGQLILSKHPIEDVKAVSFDSFIAHRVNIHATIGGIRFGFGHFAFNLLADVDPSLAPLMYGALQPQQVQDFVDAGVDVIVGDMNSGPNYQPDGYDLLFTSGYALATPTSPTWCDAERADFLPCLYAGAVPMSIDHIFVRNASRVVTWKPRLFNEEPVSSDHIGVSAKVYNCWWCIWM
jgi:endonuclease/exonuclease/phosphatase family metal-dependent hydrolase